MQYFSSAETMAADLGVELLLRADVDPRMLTRKERLSEFATDVTGSGHLHVRLREQHLRRFGKKELSGRVLWVTAPSGTVEHLSWVAGLADQISRQSGRVYLAGSSIEHLMPAQPGGRGEALPEAAQERLRGFLDQPVFAMGTDLEGVKLVVPQTNRDTVRPVGGTGTWTILLVDALPEDFEGPFPESVDGVVLAAAFRDHSITELKESVAGLRGAGLELLGVVAIGPSGEATKPEAGPARRSPSIWRQDATIRPASGPTPRLVAVPGTAGRPPNDPESVLPHRPPEGSEDPQETTWGMLAGGPRSREAEGRVRRNVRPTSPDEAEVRGGRSSQRIGGRPDSAGKGAARGRAVRGAAEPPAAESRAQSSTPTETVRGAASDGRTTWSNLPPPGSRQSDRSSPGGEFRERANEPGAHSRGGSPESPPPTGEPVGAAPSSERSGVPHLRVTPGTQPASRVERTGDERSVALVASWQRERQRRARGRRGSAWLLAGVVVLLAAGGFWALRPQLIASGRLPWLFSLPSRPAATKASPSDASPVVALEVTPGTDAGEPAGAEIPREAKLPPGSWPSPGHEDMPSRETSEAARAVGLEEVQPPAAAVSAAQVLQALRESREARMLERGDPEPVAGSDPEPLAARAAEATLADPAPRPPEPAAGPAPMTPASSDPASVPGGTALPRPLEPSVTAAEPASDRAADPASEPAVERVSDLADDPASEPASDPGVDPPAANNAPGSDPPAAVEPAPEAEVAPITEVRNGYVVHLGSFRLRTEADGEVARLRGLGLDARALHVNVPAKGPWYRVVVGGHPTFADAKARALDLRELTGRAKLNVVGKGGYGAPVPVVE